MYSFLWLLLGNIIDHSIAVMFMHVVHLLIFDVLFSIPSNQSLCNAIPHSHFTLIFTFNNSHDVIDEQAPSIDPATTNTVDIIEGLTTSTPSCIMRMSSIQTSSIHWEMGPMMLIVISNPRRT
jgi:hypothetical protein